MWQFLDGQVLPVQVKMEDALDEYHANLCRGCAAQASVEVHPSEPSCAARRWRVQAQQRFMVSFLRELQTRTRSCSVIWLHDGIWIQSSVPNSVLQQAELQVARSIGLPVDLHNPIMRIHDLHGESDSLWAEFGIEGTVGSYPPLFPISLKVKPPQFTPRHPKPVYSKKRIYPETSRIHFARRAKARRCR